MPAPINTGELLAYGEQQIGKPYVFGAAGPNTFDCSGLIQYMYKRFGVDLPHSAAQQARKGVAVDPNHIAAGDLVFSDWGDGINSHVGIALSPNQILVAPHTGSNVQVEALNSSYKQHITAVRRVGNLSGPTPAPYQGASGETAAGDSAGGGGSSSPPIFTALQGAGALPGPIGGIANLLDKGSDTLKGFGLLAVPLQDLADAFDTAMLLFKPSNFVRLAAGVSGAVFVLLGIWFLSREVRA